MTFFEQRLTSTFLTDRDPLLDLSIVLKSNLPILKIATQETNPQHASFVFALSEKKELAVKAIAKSAVAGNFISLSHQALAPEALFATLTKNLIADWSYSAHKKEALLVRYQALNLAVQAWLACRGSQVAMITVISSAADKDISSELIMPLLLQVWESEANPSYFARSSYLEALEKLIKKSGLAPDEAVAQLMKTWPARFNFYLKIIEVFPFEIVEQIVDLAGRDEKESSYFSNFVSVFGLVLEAEGKPKVEKNWKNLMLLLSLAWISCGNKPKRSVISFFRVFEKALKVGASPQAVEAAISRIWNSPKNPKQNFSVRKSLFSALKSLHWERSESLFCEIWGDGESVDSGLCHEATELLRHKLLEKQVSFVDVEPVLDKICSCHVSKLDLPTCQNTVEIVKIGFQNDVFYDVPLTVARLILKKVWKQVNSRRVRLGRNKCLVRANAIQLIGESLGLKGQSNDLWLELKEALKSMLATKKSLKSPVAVSQGLVVALSRSLLRLYPFEDRVALTKNWENAVVSYLAIFYQLFQALLFTLEDERDEKTSWTQAKTSMKRAWACEEAELSLLTTTEIHHTTSNESSGENHKFLVSLFLFVCELNGVLTATNPESRPRFVLEVGSLASKWSQLKAECQSCVKLNYNSYNFIFDCAVLTCKLQFFTGVSESEGKHWLSEFFAPGEETTTNLERCSKVIELLKNKLSTVSDPILFEDAQPMFDGLWTAYGEDFDLKIYYDSLAILEYAFKNNKGDSFNSLCSLKSNQKLLKIAWKQACSCLHAQKLSTKSAVIKLIGKALQDHMLKSAQNIEFIQLWPALLAEEEAVSTENLKSVSSAADFLSLLLEKVLASSDVSLDTKSREYLIFLFKIFPILLDVLEAGGEWQLAKRSLNKLWFAAGNNIVITPQKDACCVALSAAWPEIQSKWQDCTDEETRVYRLFTGVVANWAKSLPRSRETAIAILTEIKPVSSNCLTKQYVDSALELVNGTVKIKAFSSNQSVIREKASDLLKCVENLTLQARQKFSSSVIFFPGWLKVKSVWKACVGRAASVGTSEIFNRKQVWLPSPGITLSTFCETRAPAEKVASQTQQRQLDLPAFQLVCHNFSQYSFYVGVYLLLAIMVIQTFLRSLKLDAQTIRAFEESYQGLTETAYWKIDDKLLLDYPPKNISMILTALIFMLPRKAENPSFFLTLR